MSACFIKRDRMIWLQVKGEMGMNWEEWGQEGNYDKDIFCEKHLFSIENNCMKLP